MFWTHLCEVAGGPCTYEGDDMVSTHVGMKISEAHFNRVVDLLIAAMDAEQNFRQLRRNGASQLIGSM